MDGARREHQLAVLEPEVGERVGAGTEGRQQRDDGRVLHLGAVAVVDDADPCGAIGGVLGHQPRLVHHPQLDGPEDQEEVHRQDECGLDRGLSLLSTTHPRLQACLRAMEMLQGLTAPAIGQVAAGDGGVRRSWVRVQG
jgi:hypothetical protein